jgi:aryl-alcohol dehydrogenase-like predicted oxidoreductase
LGHEAFGPPTHCGRRPAFARETGREGPISDQPCHNLLDRSIEREVQPACVELGLGILPFSPLAGGALTGKYLDGIPSGTRGSHPDNAMFLKRFLEPDQVARTRALAALASDAGVSPATLALRWLLSRPAVASVIVGASSVSQLDQLLRAASAELSPSLLDAATRLTSPERTP